MCSATDHLVIRWRVRMRGGAVRIDRHSPDLLACSWTRLLGKLNFADATSCPENPLLYELRSRITAGAATLLLYVRILYFRHGRLFWLIKIFRSNVLRCASYCMGRAKVAGAARLSQLLIFSSTSLILWRDFLSPSFPFSSSRDSHYLAFSAEYSLFS